MNIEKRNAIRQILSGQDELPVVLSTDDMGEEYDGRVINYVPDKIDTPQPRRYNRDNQRRQMEHTHEDEVDYKSMAAFFQSRIGEIQKSHEFDLFVMQNQIAELSLENERLNKELETNVSEEGQDVPATDQ